MNNAQYLNSLPTSHWKQWHDQQARYERALDEAVAQGMSVEKAADYACSVVLGSK